jgi:protein-S-isoprenylcysteine O-methyltransferase Ste14
MGAGWTFILGLVLLFVLGAVMGNNLARDYRSRLNARILTVAIVWAFSSVHFSLVMLAAIRSTWHFNLPTSIRIGGGMVLMGVGVTICFAQGFAFRWSFKRLNFLDHSRLVTEGIYRWSRNPGLVGWTIVLAGLGLVCESAMVMFLVLVVWVGYGLLLPAEEEHLCRVFGDAYEAYRQRTARYFGLPRKTSKTSPRVTPV